MSESAEVEELVEAAALGEFRKLSINDEPDYKAHWTRRFQHGDSPELLALRGGMLADRLAYLFVAGYQAAVRRTFPEIDGIGWAVLAVSEDRSRVNPRPGLTINEHQQLSGFKTWVASSRVVDQIIVSIAANSSAEISAEISAESPGDLTYIQIPRDRPGLSLTHKNDVKFLSEMSQGIAEFSRLNVSSADYLAPIDIRQFASREPLYLYIAFCGFLLARTEFEHAAVRALLDELNDLATCDLTDPAARVRFAAIDSRVTDIFNLLQIEQKAEQKGEQKGNWDEDKGLLTLYSKGIQKRAQ